MFVKNFLNNPNFYDSNFFDMIISITMQRKKYLMIILWRKFFKTHSVTTVQPSESDVDDHFLWTSTLLQKHTHDDITRNNCRVKNLKKNQSYRVRQTNKRTQKNAWYYYITGENYFLLFYKHFLCTLSRYSCSSLRWCCLL